MANLTTSADIDTFMGSANNAAARTNLAAAGLGANTFTSTQTLAIPSGTHTYQDVKYDGTSRFAITREGFDNVTGIRMAGLNPGFGCLIKANVGGDGRILFTGWDGFNGMCFGPNEWLALGASTQLGFCSTDNGAGNSSPDAFFSRGGGAAIIQMGEDAAPVTNQHFKACNRITSDGVGANLTISGGNGRGDYGGNLLLSYYAPGGSGLAGTLTTALTLSAEGFFSYAEGINLAFGSSTGTKIGTVDSQKLAFWNKTPIVQPTTAITAASFANNSSNIVDDSATYGGYTMGQIAAALINVGILA